MWWMGNRGWEHDGGKERSPLLQRLLRVADLHAQVVELRHSHATLDNKAGSYKGKPALNMCWRPGCAAPLAAAARHEQHAPLRPVALADQLHREAAV
jgi:hypothetical protein